MGKSSSKIADIANEPSKPSELSSNIVCEDDIEVEVEVEAEAETAKRVVKRKYTKIGTFDDPIITVWDSVERTELIKILSGHYYKGKSIELKKTEINYNKWGSDERDWYILNVIYNKLLTPVDVKLALFFYNKIKLNGKFYAGLLCGVRDSRELIDLDRHYGDGTGIYILDDYHYDEPRLYSYQDAEDLVAQFNEMHDHEIPSRYLMKSLRRLHDFGYITLTNISRENQKSFKGANGFNTEKARPRLVHVRLLRWMIHNKVYDKFKWDKIDKKISNT